MIADKVTADAADCGVIVIKNRTAVDLSIISVGLIINIIADKVTANVADCRFIIRNRTAISIKEPTVSRCRYRYRVVDKISPNIGNVAGIIDYTAMNV